ncbi:MAG: hypothetical protein AAF916_11290 [Planctomycetota bacterium]
MKYLVIVLVLIHFTGAPVSWASDIKSIDRRTYSEENQYYLVFCARHGVPGHAFVIWGKEDYENNLSSQRAFGMYPKDKKLRVGAVPGGVVEEATPRSDTRLIVRVNREQFEGAASIRSAWAGKDYKLVESDCVTFTSEAAISIGLDVPARWRNLTPQGMVEALLRENN